MKGSNKQFALYLASEYNDEYLEPLDDTDSISHIQNLSKPQKQPKKVPKKVLDSHVKSEHPPIAEKQFMFSIIRKFVELLNQDVQFCVQCFETLEYVTDPELLDAFSRLYTKFETIPLLFCSVAPNEAVYLWQVNKLCPFERGTNNIATDTRKLNSQTKQTVSFMLLAKIKAEKDEIFLSGQFLGGTRLIVTSTIGENQLIMRAYDIKDFSMTAKVNPFNEEVLTTDMYFSKVVIKNVEITETGSNTLEITLWKRDPVKTWNTKEEKDTLVQTKICEGLAFPIKKFSADFIDAQRTANDVIIIAARTIGMIIAWKGEELFTYSYSNLSELEMRVADTSLFLLKNEQTDFELSFCSFPKVTEENGSRYRSSGVKEIVAHNKYLEKIKDALRKGLTGENSNPFVSIEYTVYDKNIKVATPFALKKVEVKKEEQEKAEEESVNTNLMKKVKMMKKQFKSGGDDKSDLDHKSEILKEINKDVAEMNKESLEFEVNYGNRSYKDNQANEPERPLRETLELYNQIKAEKKKMMKKREKEKSERKKGEVY